MHRVARRAHYARVFLCMLLCMLTCAALGDASARAQSAPHFLNNASLRPAAASFQTNAMSLGDDSASTNRDAVARFAASRHSDVAFLASLAIPGAGQYMLKQQRWLPYAALEGWAWIRYFERRSTARKLSDRYRDFAWDVARRVSTGERRDTTFPYYEVLIHSTSSGSFDSQPTTPGVQPEFDADTYNGQQWQLARDLFIPAGSGSLPGAPGYDAALAYYVSRAIPDEYAFAWNTGRLEQQVYTNVISDSDAAYRDATRLLGFILANHLTSAVDALISARLRSAGTNVRFESGLSPDGAAPSGGRLLRFDAQLQYIW
jgi:hypothetical protein